MGGTLDSVALIEKDRIVVALVLDSVDDVEVGVVVGISHALDLSVHACFNRHNLGSDAFTRIGLDNRRSHRFGLL